MRSLLQSVDTGEVLRVVQVDSTTFSQVPPAGEIYLFFYNNLAYLKDPNGVVTPIMTLSRSIRKITASTTALPGEFIIADSSGGGDIVVSVEETSPDNDMLEVVIQRKNTPGGGAGKITVSKTGADQLFGAAIGPVPRDNFDLLGQGDSVTMISDDADSLWRIF